MVSVRQMLAGWRRHLTRRDRRQRALAALAVPLPADVATLQRVVLAAVADAVEANVRLVSAGVLPPLHAARAGEPVQLPESVYQGPAIALPLNGPGADLGVLVASRPAGELFADGDIRLFAECAGHAGTLLTRSYQGDESTAIAVLEERSRLAREIHDGLAQHIAFLKMRVAWLRRSPDAIDDGELSTIESMLETALAEARHAISTLRSDPLGRSTSEAVRAYAAEFARVSDLQVVFDIAPFCPEVSPTARLELLRIVQESLNNVRKHAQATTVEIEIWPRDEGLEVSVRDNGRGFEPAPSRAGHFGLDIMAERAVSVGGSLSVTPDPAGGTRVSVWLPSAEGGQPGSGRPT